MTELQLFSLYNSLCLAGVVMMAAMVRRTTDDRLFATWLRAYAFVASISFAELAVAFTARNAVLNHIEFVLATAAGWFLYQAGRTLGKTWLQPRWVRAVMVVGTLATMAAHASGVPYEKACVLPVFFYIAAHFWLGVRLIRSHASESGAATSYLGGALIGFAIWTLIVYPALQTGPYFWIGFVVAGLLQLAIGAGMVVFVLAESRRRLEVQNERLMQLDRYKNELLSTVSHELRTPITAIATAAHAITVDQAVALSENQREFTGIIRENADHLARLVSDILDYSKMEAGILNYQKRVEELCKLATEACRSFRGRFEASGRTLQLVLPEQPLVVLVDRTRIVQAIANLLSNALKFTSPGGTVRVTVGRDGDWAIVTVTDDGIGIAPDQQAKVFERFYQVDSSQTRRADGMGMGLAIAKAIVEDGHGGRLEVESELGRGSTFRIRLPYEADEADDPEADDPEADDVAA